MTPKLFYGLTIAAVVTASAASITYYTTRTWSSQVAAGDAVFSELADQQEEVASLTIAQGGESITLERGETGWGIAERDGFRANADKIREAIVGLTQLQVYEAKTRNPDRYSLLELGDPEADDAKSKLVHLRDGDGNTLAALVLGKVKYGLLGPGRNGVYARIPGNDQSWLLNGSIPAPTEVRSWADKTVLDIPPEDISAIRISHGDGEHVVIERANPDAETPVFVVANLPDGAAMKSDADLPFHVQSTGQLELWDVRRAASSDMAEDSVETTIDIELANGVNVTLHMVTEGGEEHWVSAFAWGGAEVANEVRVINERARGWQFMVQDYKAEVFGKRMADLIEGDSEEGS